MNRRGIGFVSSASVLAAGGAMLGLLYACSGDDNNAAPPPTTNDASASSSGGSSSGSSSGASSSGSSSGASSSGSSSGTADGGPAPACSSLPGSIVYIESGDTQEPLLKALGRKLRDEANVTLVYQLTGSCTLTPNVYNGVSIPANTSMFYIPSTAENPTWTPSMAENTCTMSAATPPDLGISALFVSSCAGIGAPPTGIGTFNGPIQAYTFIVPSAEFTNGQTSIAAAEAYYAFGDGAGNPVTLNGNAEWNDPTQFFLRPKTKSTLVTSAYNIGLTATQMTAVEADGGTADGRQLLAQSTQVLSGVKASTSAQAIGILGDEVYDANRGAGVNVLAFSAFGQTNAYYPDSTTTSFDKQNIRDGHYTNWSPTVYIAKVDNTNTPTNAAVKYVIDTVFGNPNPTPPTGLVDGGAPIDGLGLTVGVGLTPSCAMEVQRTGDGAPLSAYAPPSPCTCYFLSKVTGATLPASCTTCTGSGISTCAAGSLGCFNGFCESPSSTADAGTCGGTGDGCITNAPTTATAVPPKANLTIPTLADGGLEPVTL
jgi:hypothetical protein